MFSKNVLLAVGFLILVEAGCSKLTPPPTSLTDQNQLPASREVEPELADERAELNRQNQVLADMGFNLSEKEMGQKEIPVFNYSEYIRRTRALRKFIQTAETYPAYDGLINRRISNAQTYLKLIDEAYPTIKKAALILEEERKIAEAEAVVPEKKQGYGDILADKEKELDKLGLVFKVSYSPTEVSVAIPDFGDSFLNPSRSYLQQLQVMQEYFVAAANALEHAATLRLSGSETETLLLKQKVIFEKGAPHWREVADQMVLGAGQNLSKIGLNPKRYQGVDDSRSSRYKPQLETFYIFWDVDKYNAYQGSVSNPDLLRTIDDYSFALNRATKKFEVKRLTELGKKLLLPLTPEGRVVTERDGLGAVVYSFAQHNSDLITGNWVARLNEILALVNDLQAGIGLNSTKSEISAQLVKGSLARIQVKLSQTGARLNSMGGIAFKTTAGHVEKDLATYQFFMSNHEISKLDFQALAWLTVEHHRLLSLKSTLLAYQPENKELVAQVKEEMELVKSLGIDYFKNSPDKIYIEPEFMFDA